MDKIFVQKSTLNRFCSRLGAFSFTLDTLLSSCYDDVTTRDDFISLMTYIERLMSFSKDNNTAWFENHKLRPRFGRPTINKKRFWKLDLLIKKLVENNVLVKTDYNKAHKKTRNYSYTTVFSYYMEEFMLENEIKIVQEKISDKYYKLLRSNSERPDKTNLQTQYDLLKSDRFQIDVMRSLKWVSNQHYIEQSISFNQFMCYNRMIFDLDNKHIFVSEGEKTGRVFTNFNLIKRELREFCTIDGEQLKSIDLKSSQPYFLFSYLLDKYPSKESNKLYQIVTEDDIYNWFLDKWKDKKQDFYTTWDMVNNIRKPIYINDRDDSKVEFLKFVFKIKGARSQYDIIFEDEFPELHKLISKIKDNLALKLQKVESSIFIPVATSFCDRGCLSVHDSLYYKPVLESKIKSSLDNQFKYLSYKHYSLN